MKKIFIVLLIIGLLVLTACTSQSIKDVKSEENIGETVTIKGNVDSSFKIGDLSGYILNDGTDTISVSSDDLPKEGTTVRVSGTLIRDTIFGYYIKAN